MLQGSFIRLKALRRLARRNGSWSHSPKKQWLSFVLHPNRPERGGKVGRAVGASHFMQVMEVRMRKILFGAALAAAAAITTTPAVGQVNNAGGLITVNIPLQNVAILNDFLNQDQITLLSNNNVPITVQAPISVAANVCHLSVAALASQKNKGGGSCEAHSGSSALARLVSQQVLNQKMKRNQ